MNTQQPNALRLAHALSGGKMIDDSTEWADTLHAAAAELRRQHARIEELEAQLSAIGAGGVEAPAAPVSTYVEVRECSDCGHVGINDTDGSKAACNTCDWQGDSPREDKCPGCNRVGTMSAACPKCGSRTLLLAETHLLAAAPQAVQAAVPVGGQSRFKGEKDWQWCSAEHVAMVLATPSEWQNYEVRYVYAHPAEGVPVQVVELEVDDLIDRLLNAQQDLNLAANVHMDQSIASASTLLDEVEIALRTLADTQPAAQGMDAQTLKHISALSELVRMPNAEHFADAHNAAVRHLRSLAAQAKQGERP